MLDQLDKVTLNFSPDSLLTLNIILGFIMFGVALGIKTKRFKNIARNPKPVIVGFVSQFFLLPALTFGLTFLLRDMISTTMALGMILVAACPGGNISNFFSYMAKGNIALSVTMTAVANLASIVMTTFNFTFWGGLYAATSPYVRPLDIDAIEVLKTVTVLLGVPLFAGLWFAKRFPKITLKIKKPIASVSLLFFAGFLIVAFYNNFDFFLKYVKYLLFIVFAHNTVALLTGYGISSLFKLPKIDRRSITIETGIQNSGIALVLIFNPDVFPADLQVGGMAMIAAWWGIWHNVVGVSLGWFWGSRPIKEHITQ